MNKIAIIIIISVLVLVGAVLLFNRPFVVVNVRLLENVHCPEEDISFERITAYSPLETCGPCIMASGKFVYIGAVACPRAIPLGTKVEIGGFEYICEDRTSLWIENERGPTFDIFFWSYDEAINFGVKKLLVRRLD